MIVPDSTIRSLSNGVLKRVTALGHTDANAVFLQLRYISVTTILTASV